MNHDQAKVSDPQLATLNERVTETYKSLITLSVEGFRYLALVNGGAIVALLTYLGNIGKNGGKAPNLEGALYGFIVGLIACGVAMFFAYITQRQLFDALLKHGTFLDTHKCAMWAGMAFYGLSLVGFIYGAVSAVTAFQVP